MLDFLNSFKKGSKSIHRILSNTVRSNNFVLADMRVTKKYFALIDLPVPEEAQLKILYSVWGQNFLPNKFRDFIFKFTNNLLGLNIRTVHFTDRVNRSCTFCTVAGTNNPHEETFLHLFYDCIHTKKILVKFYNKFLLDLGLDNMRLRALWFGTVPVQVRDKIFLLVLILYLQFEIWEYKLKGRLPNYNKIEYDVLQQLRFMTNVKKICAAMMKILLFLGIGIILQLMESTGDSVVGCYTQQRELEEEEQEKLLAVEPGESEDVTPPWEDILDVSMEEQPGTGQTTEGKAAHNKTPERPPQPEGAATAALRDMSLSNTVTNLNRGVTSNNGTKPNPNEGGEGNNTAISSVEEPNPNRGGNSNKVQLYLSTKSRAASVTLPNLNRGGNGVTLADCGSFLIEGDSRFEQVTVRSDICNGTNTTYSFDPDKMVCECCGQFRKHVVGGGGGGVQD
jgi:hypothetical protein